MGVVTRTRKRGPHEDLRDGNGRSNLKRNDIASDRAVTEPLAGFVGNGSVLEVTRDGLTSAQRVEALQAVVEKLIKRNPPKHPGLPLLWDEDGGDAALDADDVQSADPQWPPAQLLKLRQYLRQMDGLLVDTEA